MSDQRSRKERCWVGGDVGGLVTIVPSQLWAIGKVVMGGAPLCGPLIAPPLLHAFRGNSHNWRLPMGSALANVWLPCFWAASLSLFRCFLFREESKGKRERGEGKRVLFASAAVVHLFK